MTAKASHDLLCRARRAAAGDHLGGVVEYQAGAEVGGEPNKAIHACPFCRPASLCTLVALFTDCYIIQTMSIDLEQFACI